MPRDSLPHRCPYVNTSSLCWEWLHPADPHTASYAATLLHIRHTCSLTLAVTVVILPWTPGLQHPAASPGCRGPRAGRAPPAARHRRAGGPAALLPAGGGAAATGLDAPVPGPPLRAGRFHGARGASSTVSWLFFTLWLREVSLLIAIRMPVPGPPRLRWTPPRCPRCFSTVLGLRGGSWMPAAAEWGP